MNSAQGALLLEELLTNPKYAPALRVLSAAVPTQVRDQALAADRDTAAMANLIGAAIGGGDAVMHDAKDVPEWLRLDLLTRFAAFASGTADTCMHGPSPDLPQMVFAAACKPNLIVCGRCAHLLHNRPGSDADRTCDRCGRICARLEDGEGIHPGISYLGALIFSYGLCPGCHSEQATK